MVKVLCAVVLALTAAGAQGPPPHTGLIAGTVVMGDPGRPVPHATVSIGCIGANPPVRDRVRADVNGRFAFFNLPAGEHRLCASGPANASRPTATVRLAQGQRVGDVVMRMTSSSSGAVSGLITDAAGRPAIGVRVMLLGRLQPGGGFWQRGAAVTDDRGEYRLRAAPGEYLVMVPSTQVSVPAAILETFAQLRRDRANTTTLQRELNAAGVTVGTVAPAEIGTAQLLTSGSMATVLSASAQPPRTGSDGRPRATPTIFYPGTTNPSTATRLTVSDVQEVTGINIQLVEVPAVRVAGQLVNPAGAAGPMAVRLVLPQSDGLEADLDVASTVSSADGGFEFPSVPAGDVVLRVLHVPRAPAATPAAAQLDTGAAAPPKTLAATGPPAPTALPEGPTWWADVPLSLNGKNVTDLVVPVRQGATISGRVEAPAALTPAQLQRIIVSIARADGRSLTGGMVVVGSAISGRVDNEGRVRLPGLPAGRYTFYAGNLPQGHTVKALAIGGRDVTETAFDLTADDQSSLVLTLTSGLSIITGAVRADRALPDGVQVLVFPADRRTWTNPATISRRMRVVTVNTSGVFTTTPLPPGEYFVVAAHRDDRPQFWQTPGVLDLLMRDASRVTLTDGQTLRQDVPLRSR